MNLYKSSENVLEQRYYLPILTRISKKNPPIPNVRLKMAAFNELDTEEKRQDMASHLWEEMDISISTARMKVRSFIERKRVLYNIEMDKILRED